MKKATKKSLKNALAFKAKLNTPLTNVTNLKKGQTVYIVCQVGLMHVNAYKGTLLYYRKVNGKKHSMRVLVSQSLTGHYAFSEEPFKKTIRLQLTKNVYTFYDTFTGFYNAIHQINKNRKKVIDVFTTETKLFLNTPRP